MRETESTNLANQLTLLSPTTTGLEQFWDDYTKQI